jgi:hypothetical protein
MRVEDFRRPMIVVLLIVIFFTIFAVIMPTSALLRGIWLALIWQVASIAVLTACAYLMTPPVTRMRGWLLAGAALVKFGALYWAGYLALQALQPSGVGITIGMTIPWVVVVCEACRISARDSHVYPEPVS